MTRGNVPAFFGIVLAWAALTLLATSCTDDGDGDPDGDVESEADGDVEAEADTDSDADGDVDGHADGGADGDTDGDTDVDVDADADSDMDGDGDADGDAGGDFTCGAETCTDPTTRLEWQRVAPVTYYSQEDAVDYCDTLGLAGDGWRLPSAGELRSLLRGCFTTVTGGSCRVSDTCLEYGCRNLPECLGCAEYGGSGSGGMYWPSGLEGPSWYFWTSSLEASASEEGWYVIFVYAGIGHDFTDMTFSVRCVRDY